MHSKTLHFLADNLIINNTVKTAKKPKKTSENVKLNLKNKSSQRLIQKKKMLFV